MARLDIARLGPGSVSFCITCRNRLWQLEQTLPGNLAAAGEGDEFALVDFGSTDGLANWVWSRFRGEIEAGRLTFFEVTNDVRWSSPRAKNLAHRIARGAYLFNLDADNFIDSGEVAAIRRAAQQGRACHQFSGSYPDGSFGRIGMPRDLFFDLGGYDESLLPMGSQDVDLVERLRAVGHHIVQLPPPARQAVSNSVTDKVAETGGGQDANSPESLYIAMNRLNGATSKVRRMQEGPRRVGGFMSYTGRLNGTAVSIDGFNVIRPQDEARVVHDLRPVLAGDAGTSSRGAWVDLMWQVARPVLERGASGELASAAPFQAQPGWGGPGMASLEAAARTLCGIAPWLGLDVVPEGERRRQEEGRRLALATLAALVTPGGRGHAAMGDHPQSLVEGGFIAMALLRAPRVLWSGLEPATRGHVVAALAATRGLRPYFNHWVLYPALVEAMFCKLGQKHDMMRLEYAVRQFEQWYVGDGMYTDGPSFRAGFSNSFVIHPFLLEALVATGGRRQWGAHMQSAEQRVRRQAELLERQVSPEGTLPATGGSLGIRCGALHTLAFAALTDRLGPSMNRGGVRRAMWAVIHRTLGAPGTLDAQGWLQPGVGGAQPSLLEETASAGTSYAALLAFQPLGLPATAPFWMAPDSPFTTELLYGGGTVKPDVAMEKGDVRG
jgi:hypothetical protein